MADDAMKRAEEVVEGFLNRHAHQSIKDALKRCVLPAITAAVEAERERLGVSTQSSDVAGEIAAEIIEIMATRDQQEAEHVYGGTPGGLEHMGDVWNLLGEWRERLIHSRTPSPEKPNG